MGAWGTGSGEMCGAGGADGVFIASLLVLCGGVYVPIYVDR